MQAIQVRKGISSAGREIALAALLLLALVVFTVATLAAQKSASAPSHSHASVVAGAVGDSGSSDAAGDSSTPLHGYLP